MSHQGVILPDPDGQPYVIIPVAVGLDFFQQLRGGVVGIASLRMTGDGCWALDMQVASEADEHGVTYREEAEPDGE